MRRELMQPEVFICKTEHICTHGLPRPQPADNWFACIMCRCGLGEAWCCRDVLCRVPL